MTERLRVNDVNDDADEPMARDDSRGEALDPLFDSDYAAQSRGRWQELQSRFVDDPRNTVEQADVLVSGLLDELGREFSNARSDLERQWSEGEDVSTEDLRLTLRRYRSFFERLLAA